MIPITVYVPETKLQLFNELMDSLHFEKTITEEIPEWHKTIIDQRLAEYELNPTDMMNWDNVKDKFKI